MNNIIEIVSNCNPLGDFPGGMVVYFKVDDVKRSLAICRSLFRDFGLRDRLSTDCFSTIIRVDEYRYILKEEDTRVRPERSMIDFLKKYLPEIKNIFQNKVVKDLSLIKIDTGWLYNDYGKYCPNLTFVSKSPFDFLMKDDRTLNDFNLGSNQKVKIMSGRFFTSKKGTKCFKINAGNDILVSHDWGGHEKYADRNCYLDKLPQQKYFRRASSNGGGVGTDYVVIPEGTTYVVREEDI